MSSAFWRHGIALQQTSVLTLGRWFLPPLRSLSTYAIDRVRVGACPGTDGVPAAMLCLLDGRAPVEAWRRSAVVCLQKPGTDRTFL